MAMFDAHCHIGTLRCTDALVCTSRVEEYGSIKDFTHRAYGILEPGRQDLDALDGVLATDADALVGEVGMDARWPDDGRGLLDDILHIISKHKRPFVLHVVRRHEEVLGILAAAGIDLPFMVHGFTSSPQVALRYMRLGGIISLGPSCPATRHYRELLDLPFLLESDMPLSPDSQGVLDRLYTQVAADMGIERPRLEEMIDERRAVLTS